MGRLRNFFQKEEGLEGPTFPLTNGLESPMFVEKVLTSQGGILDSDGSNQTGRVLVCVYSGTLRKDFRKYPKESD